MAHTSEKLWNKDYNKVMLSNFLLFLSFYLLMPILPLYLDRQFQADKHVIGIVLSGYVIATFLIRPCSGYIVDSFDRKKILTVCFFFFFILFFGYVGAGTLLLFAIVRTFHGIPFGAATVANSTVAIDVLPSSRRNEGLGFYGLGNNIAMATAPSIGIYLYNETGNFSFLFWISLVIAFLGYIVTTTIKIPKRVLIENKPKLDWDHFFLLKGWLLALNICLFGTCWGVMANYVAIYGEQALGLDSETGIFFMILAVGLVISRLMGRKRLRRGELTRSGAEGVILSAIGYVLFALSLGIWGYYLSALLIGLGNGRMYPSILNMFINIARNDQRGTANSSILISWDFGMGLGILLGGFISEFIGFTAAFWFVAAVQLLGTLLYLTLSVGFYNRNKLPR